MDAIADAQDSFLDLSKLSAQEIKVLREFYSFLLFKRKSKIGKSKKDIKKVPKVFYHPTKIKTYVAFERNEIY